MAQSMSMKRSKSKSKVMILSYCAIKKVVFNKVLTL